MAIATPAAKFVRPFASKAAQFERRNICVLPKTQCDLMIQRDTVMRCGGGNHVHYTRSRVAGLIASGEMRWVDRHRNVATWVTGETWQKTRSGPVHTMQLISGLKGRAVPATQREAPLCIA